MSETKPTPGPWVIDPLNLGTPWNIGTVKGASVAIAFQLEDDPIAGQPKRTANARLIAAAPDYDHAARALVARHDALASEYDGTTRCECQDCALFRPIIARAEGR